MNNVFIVGGGRAYAALFQSLGFGVVADIAQANLVCFTGGADVTPSLYGAEKHPLTGNSPARDLQEKTVYENAQALGIPCVGICRGAQFLNVMSGGEMYQHVTEHTRSHYIVDNITGETVYVSSTHHQMMKPFGVFVLVASSNLGGEREWYESGVFKKALSDQDNEVVYYPETNCLCFQPHPEFDNAEYEGMRIYFASLLSRYLGF